MGILLFQKLVKYKTAFCFIKLIFVFIIAHVITVYILAMAKAISWYTVLITHFSCEGSIGISRSIFRMLEQIQFNQSVSCVRSKCGISVHLVGEIRRWPCDYRYICLNRCIRNSFIMHVVSQLRFVNTHTHTYPQSTLSVRSVRHEALFKSSNPTHNISSEERHWSLSHGGRNEDTHDQLQALKKQTPDNFNITAATEYGPPANNQCTRALA